MEPGPSFRCLVCGVTLAVASWHCPIHAVKFAIGRQAPLYRPPVIELVQLPRDLGKHTHVEVGGDAEKLGSEILNIATSTGHLSTTPDDVVSRNQWSRSLGGRYTITTAAVGAEVSWSFVLPATDSGRSTST